ncbi:hypothetical protein QMO17_34070, partial [Klebsiella pneumoniae]|nr:hypothetical protein [Klebsiella pneumoniae]
AHALAEMGAPKPHASGQPGAARRRSSGDHDVPHTLLSAKVYEALHEDALGKKSVAEVLRADYFGKVDGLNDKSDAALMQSEEFATISESSARYVSPD